MPTARKPVAKDIAFTLGKETAPYRVVSVLQERFKEPEKTNAEGKVVAPRKLQGRLLIGAVLEAVLQYASPATLEALANDVKDKGEGEKKGKASEYIAAIASARSVAPSTPSAITSVSDEELKAELARREAAKAAGAKTKNVDTI
jgi:hypothetical protein